MGFHPQERTALVVGEDAYAGFEATVLISPIPMSFVFEIQEQMASEDRAAIRQAFIAFGDRILRSWNLEDANDAPIPATGAGILLADQGLVGQLIKGWGDATNAPPLPSVNGREPQSIPASAH